MDNKKLANDMFRLAFSYLRATRPGTLKEIAAACECSEKHLGNILNKEGIGSSPDIKRAIADYYGTTIEEMLLMGKEITDGGFPVHQQINNRDQNGQIVQTNANEVGSIQVSINGESDEYTVKLSRKEYEVWMVYCEMKRPEMLLDACIDRMKKIKQAAGLG